MCGRLSQYRGIHDFVALLAMPGALINNAGKLQQREPAELV